MFDFAMKKTHILVTLVASIACSLCAATWSRSSDNRFQYPTSVACSSDGRTVYLIVQQSPTSTLGRLLKSSDGGQTWSEIAGQER